MGRRRKSPNAADGFLLLLVIAVVVAIFLVRLALTLIAYGMIPVLLTTWLATLTRQTIIFFGDPNEYDDERAWEKIAELKTKRNYLFHSLREKYEVGFRSGLTVTAKSESRLFHAGSKLGKRLNAEIESLYSDIGSISSEIRELRLNVLCSIPCWRLPFNIRIRNRRLHVVSGALLIILFTIASTLHATSVLPSELAEKASGILLWNPDPSHITGDLVVSFLSTAVVGCLIWPFSNTQSLEPAVLDIYRKWETLEAKWSQNTEHAEFTVDESSFHKDPQDTPRSQHREFDLPWYKVLNVTEFASPEEIKCAYREAIWRYHPDKVSGLDEKLRTVAEEESKKINAAFSEARRQRGFV